MKILAVDTSSMVAAVAVMDDATLLGEMLINHQKTHSQKLMPMIRQLLNGLDLRPEDVDLFAASSGPGSFTGLRIGITTLKAMAYALEKPVAAVPTLDALAFNLPLGDALICPMLDARNGQVYTALYAWEQGKQVKLTEYLGVHVTELVKLVASKNRRVVFLGDGVPLHRDLLKMELGDRCSFAPGSLMLQRAAAVAELAFGMAKRGQLENAFDMVPFYLRKSQAEREYEKRGQMV